MASGGNFNPPADLIDKRDQTKYRIESELRYVGKKMDQNMLNNAAKQASEKEREKWRDKNIVDMLDPYKDAMTNARALEAGEKERARLIADERNRLKARGELKKFSTREKFNSSIEEKSKSVLWRQWSEQEKKRSLAMDKQAVDIMDKELGPSYKLSPKMLSMDLKRTELPDNWRTGVSKSSENWRAGRSNSPENWRKNRPKSPDNWRKK